MLHAIDRYFLTVGFANPPEKPLFVLGHLPTGMLLSLEVFFFLVLTGKARKHAVF